MDKNCTQCNCIKKLTEYYQKKNGYFRSECKKCTLEKCKLYRDKNKNKVSECIKKCRKNNHTKYLETEKRYRGNNNDNIVLLRTENKEKYAISKRKYEKNKLLTDPIYKILKNTRRRINRAFKDKSVEKSEKSVLLLGCSSKFLKNWLEYQFNSNMTWNNYGHPVDKDPKGFYWEIDHVIPCASFNLINKNEQYKCFNWTNCRPMKGIDNNLKNDKIIPLQILLQEIRVYYYKIVCDKTKLRETPKVLTTTSEGNYR